MFESFEKRQPRKSVVQPVLALVVHAGLISLALQGEPAAPNQRLTAPMDTLPIYVPSMPSLDGSPSPGGTQGDPPVSIPIEMPTDLPPLTRVVTAPMSRPGPFDPRPYLAFPSGPDSTAAGATILTESDLTDPPRTLHLAEPRYPEALRQAGVEGSVTVTYVVDISGFVEPGSIRIVSSDYPAFAEAVLASVGTARFTPGRVQGRPVRVLVRQVIRFANRS